MTTLALSNSIYSDKMSGPSIDPDLEKWRASFVVSAMLGATCGITGFAMAGVHLVGLAGGYHYLDNVGAGFLIMAFLLLSAAAHSLDRARRPNLR